MRKKENKQRGVSFVLPPDEIADLEEIARAGRGGRSYGRLPSAVGGYLMVVFLWVCPCGFTNPPHIQRNGENAKKQSRSKVSPETPLAPTGFILSGTVAMTV
jgi:hypothetical protein